LSLADLHANVRVRN